jgi:hypothetical protein
MNIKELPDFEQYAAELKKLEDEPDTFRVDLVHPVDGSLRIWNPTTKEWGFLYPDEVKLVPAPDDSVTPVEFAVTESNPPAPDDFLAINAVSTYRPRGTARGISPEYYRLYYEVLGKVRHIQIRGGNVRIGNSARI